MAKEDDKIDSTKIVHMSRAFAKSLPYIIVAIILAIVSPVISYWLVESLERLGLTETFLPYVEVSAYVIVSLVVIELVRKALTNSLKGVLRERTIKNVISLFRITAYVTLLLLLISTLQGDVTLGAAIGGFAGLLVGFASKEIIGNAVAGLYIAVARPFEIEDCVDIAGCKGEVKDITLTYTIVESSDNICLIPNSKAIGSVVKLRKKS